MSLELVIGPMFAGKSSAILRMANRYKSIEWPHCLITHSSDTRYSDLEYLVSHDQISIPCFRWDKLLNHKENKILLDSRAIIIDEAQFFPDLYDFVIWLVDTLQKDVIVVGLDGDANRKPFGQILELVPLADRIRKLKSFCANCKDGTEALFTFCKKASEKKEQIQVGGSETYMPVCRKCYINLSTS